MNRKEKQFTGREKAKRTCSLLPIVSVIIAAGFFLSGCTGQIPLGPVAIRSPLIVKKSLVVNADDTLAPQFQWADNRPIAALHLSAGTHATATNPAGWIFDLFPTASPSPTFAEQMRAYCTATIADCQWLGAQGVIVWDIEGWSLQNKSRIEEYIGSPDLAVFVNQDFTPALYAEFFKRFRDAGLQAGVCIRPIEVDPNTGRFTLSADPYATLLRKAKYARTVWKCRLIYVDSSVDAAGNPLPAIIAARLLKALPDVRIIFENETPDNYLYGRPYLALENGEAGTPADVRRSIPAATAVVEVNAGDIAGRRSDLIDSVRRGDILLVNGWRTGSRMGDVREIYAAAKGAN